MEHQFDELAKALAGEMPRREALRRIGSGLATALLASQALKSAWADGGSSGKRCNSGALSRCLDGAAALCSRQRDICLKWAGANTSRQAICQSQYSQCSQTGTKGCSEWFGCPSGQACQEGRCVAGCSPACTGGRVCVNGTCECPMSQSFCDGTCKDTASDVNNCGGCNQSCGRTERCCAGKCTPVSVQSCTACGTPCPATQCATTATTGEVGIQSYLNGCTPSGPGEFFCDYALFTVCTSGTCVNGQCN